MSIFYWVSGLVFGVAILLYGLAWNRTRIVQATFPPIGQFVTVNGAAVHYTKSGSGPPVILLHGAGGNLRDWHYSLVPELEKTNTVITFDRPGHGYTAALHSRGATLGEQAAMLHAAAKIVGVQHAQVLGYSYGGAVALRMALDFPQFVSGLVLVSAVTNEWPGAVDGLYRHVAHPMYGGITATILGGVVPLSRINRGYAEIFSPQTAPDGYMAAVGAPLTTRPESFRANSKQVMGLKPQIIEQSKRYSDLTQQIQVLHGTADTSVYYDVHTPQFLASAPNAQLTTLEGMGHGAHILAQDEILAAFKSLSN